MKEILKQANKVELINDGQICNVNNLAERFIELLDGAYFSPSYITADNDEIQSAKEKGLWIEFSFENTQSFKDYTFDKLLLLLKPKYNFINFYRMLDEEYTGKCINFNLAIKTTDLYKELLKEIKG